MALTIAKCHSVTKVDWSEVDTVLLDMDGTLLDLRFDNEFWLNTIPAKYGDLNGITAGEASERLAPLFTQEAGKLNWYCLDFWSEALGFNVGELKRQVSHGVNWRPEAETFLKRLRASHCEALLITNAHPETLEIKLERVNLAPWLDQMYSSHSFHAPKESQTFWQALMATHPFNPERTLFIDDSESVLASAQQYGIAHLITLRQPDSTAPVREQTRFPAIHHFNEIYQGLGAHD